MPLSEIQPKLIPIWDSQLREDLSKINFWRTAARSEFDNIFFQTIGEPGSTKRQTVKDDIWLDNLGKLESPESYQRRARHVIDPASSGTIISTYLGYYSKIQFDKFDSGLETDIDKRVRKDIDLKKTTIESFNIEILEELLAVGKTYIAVDAMNIFKTTVDGEPELIDGQPVFDSSFPYAFIIKREDVMDFQGKENEVGFEWLKYQRWVEKSNNLKKEQVRQIIIVDDSFWYICENISGTWQVIEKRQNNLGEVPMVDVKMGKNALPIINTIAKWQLDIMNFQSEVRNTLSIQSINNLQMPESMAKRFNKASAKSILVHADNATTFAKWIAPPSNTLTPHFGYLEYAFKNLTNSANLKREQKKQVESQGAKEIDFFDSEAVMNFASDAIESADKRVITLFGKFTDQSSDIEPDVKYDRKYIKDTLLDLLNEALQADLLQMGETAMIKITKKVRDRFDLDLTPGETKLSDKEIMELIQGAVEKKKEQEDNRPVFEDENIDVE